MSEKDFFPQRQGVDFALTDPAAIAAAEAVKAKIQSAYIMAMRKPRNEMGARDRILMACKRSEFAGKAEYNKPVGGKGITGPSIRFAELALREWGNILIDVQTVYEDENLRRVKVSATDLETNAQFSKDIQIKKIIERKSKKNREDDVVGIRKNSYGQTVHILKATDDEMYTKEAAWVSKVLRNEGLRLIPTDIIEEGMQTARATVANRVIQDPEGEKKKILDAFSSLGIKPKELEKHLNHTIDVISPAELVSLRVIYQSIRDGETSWADYVVDKDEEPLTEAVDKFKSFVKENIKLDAHELLDDFILQSAKALSITTAKLKAQASDDMESFAKEFQKWAKAQRKQKKASLSLGFKPPTTARNARPEMEPPDSSGDAPDAREVFTSLAKSEMIEVLTNLAEEKGYKSENPIQDLTINKMLKLWDELNE